MSWSSRKKKEAIFVPFLFLSKRKFFNICVLSQCIVYWIYFWNIHTFTYQKTLLHTLFRLFLKSAKAFSVSLKNSSTSNTVNPEFLSEIYFDKRWFLMSSVTWLHNSCNFNNTKVVIDDVIKTNQRNCRSFSFVSNPGNTQRRFNVDICWTNVATSVNVISMLIQLRFVNVDSSIKFNVETTLILRWL